MKKFGLILTGVFLCLIASCGNNDDNKKAEENNDTGIADSTDQDASFNDTGTDDSSTSEENDASSNTDAAQLSGNNDGGAIEDSEVEDVSEETDATTGDAEEPDNSSGDAESTEDNGDPEDTGNVETDIQGQCVSDSDCTTGVESEIIECRSWVPGGFCTVCSYNDECPEKHLCSTEGVCLRKCGSNVDCPTGLECNLHSGDSVCGLMRCSSGTDCPEIYNCNCLPGADPCTEMDNHYCLAKSCDNGEACPQGTVCQNTLQGNFCARTLN